MHKILDCHTHTYPEAIAARAAENLGAFYNFVVTESGTLKTLEKDISDAGMDGFLLLPVATSPNNVDKINIGAAEQIKSARNDGFEVYSFGCMHQEYPDFDKGLDLIQELGLMGVKLHPDLQAEDCDSDRLFSLYEKMEKRGLSLYLHAGDQRPEMQYSAPERIARIAETFPKMKICAAHFGGYRVWERAKKSLYGKYDNVWYDCSSSLHIIDTGYARELISACGTDRMMFGSDYPAISPQFCYDGFVKLGYEGEVADNILYHNLRRFLCVEGSDD